MKKKQNLKYFDQNQSRDKAKQNGKKGGLKSGESRRRNKGIKKIIDTIINAPAHKDIIASLKGEMVIENVDLSNYEVMVMAQCVKAMKGDTKAFNAICDRLEGKPLQETIEYKPEMTLADYLSQIESSN